MKAALQYLHEILTLLGQDLRKIPAMIILFFAVSLLDFAGLGLIAPYITLVLQPDMLMNGWVGDLLNFFDLNAGQDRVLIWLSGVLVTLFLCKGVVALVINNLIIRFAQDQQVRLRSKLMNNYQHLPYSIFLQRNSAEYINTLQTLTGQFQAVLQQLLRSVSDVFVVLVIMGLLLIENATALILLVFVVGGNLLIYELFTHKRMKNYGIRLNKASEEIIKCIHEAIEGLKEIRILGRESHFHDKLYRKATTWSFNQRRHLLIQQAPRYMLEVSLVIFVVLLVLLTRFWENSTHSMLGTLGLFGVAAIRLAPIASQLAATLTTLRFQRDAVSRLYADVKNFTIPYSKFPPSNLNEFFTSLKLKDIQYSYPNTNLPALKKLTLEINAGESIGLIGASGGGKTTLIDVLLGLLKPQFGKMEFNGKPLSENIEKFRSQVAYLPQQVFLIDDSLECNVALGETKSEIDQNRLQEALRQAQLIDLIDQLPQGINTLLGEHGMRLSGGQRQRVALARAFYYGRNILIMDEATSALDNETEQEIVEEIRRLKGLKTMIVIAHRLTTVRHCDRIYRLEKGRIVDVGPPEKIIVTGS